MKQARLVEFGVVGVNVLFLAVALVVGLRISGLAGLLLFGLLTVGFLFLFYNYDYPLVRRLAKADDQVMVNLCRTGFVGRTRRMFRGLPSNPRCRFCLVPFGGMGKLIGIKPAAKNPNYCRSCFEGLPTKTHEMKIGVLFADIRGFTSWTETHATADAAEALTRFYAIANRVLTTDDAFVEFVGDQVMALYLVELPSLGERTADVMLTAAKRLVVEVRKEEDVLPVGVGLNIGFAQVGSIAKGEAKDFTAVGDVVNTGARLQGSAQEFEIVVSENVYAALAESVPEAKPTTFDVKGKAEPLKAFVIAASV
jgi:adenylate cyclase